MSYSNQSISSPHQLFLPKVSKKSSIFVFKITISSACYFLYLGQSISDGCSWIIGVCFIHTLTPPPSFIAIRIITRIHVLFIEFRKAVRIVNNIFGGYSHVKDGCYGDVPGSNTAGSVYRAAWALAAKNADFQKQSWSGSPTPRCLND